MLPETTCHAKLLCTHTHTHTQLLSDKLCITVKAGAEVVGAPRPQVMPHPHQREGCAQPGASEMIINLTGWVSNLHLGRGR